MSNNKESKDTKQLKKFEDREAKKAKKLKTKLAGHAKRRLRRRAGVSAILMTPLGAKGVFGSSSFIDSRVLLGF